MFAVLGSFPDAVPDPEHAVNAVRPAPLVATPAGTG
jgi:hypothetical protein